MPNGGRADSRWPVGALIRGAGRNRTDESRFCRPLPYHLATAPARQKSPKHAGFSTPQGLHPNASHDPQFALYWGKGFRNKWDSASTAVFWTQDKNHGDAWTANLSGKRFAFLVENEMWY